MARSRRSNRARANTSPIATRSVRARNTRPLGLPSRVAYKGYDATVGRVVLDDRRMWHPERVFRPAFSLKRAATQLVLKKPTAHQKPRLTEGLAFKDPRKVLICVRRRIRKNIMHAIGAAGGKVKKPRRNYWSDVTC